MLAPSGWPSNCIAGTSASPESASDEPELRGWKQCHCPIYADGTLGGTFKRRNTKGTSGPLGHCSQAYAGRSGARLDETGDHHHAATEAYLANRAGRDIAPATLSNYQTVLLEAEAPV